MTTDESKQSSFWTSIPGILTGIAGVLSAITALYLALSPSNTKATDPKLTAPEHITQPIPKSAVTPSEWPLIFDETFANNSNGWYEGDFPTESTPRFDLRLVNGKYRWDVAYSLGWQRYVLAPVGTAVNFSLGVDVKVIDYTPPEAGVDLIFCATEEKRYVFAVSTTGMYHLSYIGADMANHIIIEWSRFSTDFDSKKWNRLEVVVNDQTMRFYVNSKLVGEYKDVNLTGGKVGLGVALYQNGTAVVDFDNFQLRGRP